MERTGERALNRKGLDYSEANDEVSDEDLERVQAILDEHGPLLMALICEAVAEQLEEWESTDDEEARHARREAEEEWAERYDLVDEDEVDPEVRGLFDDPDEEDDDWDDEDEDELDDDSSEARPSFAAVRKRFTLQTVHVHGGTVFGLSGSCDWDEEHGIGVLFNGTELELLGQASEAFS